MRLGTFHKNKFGDINGKVTALGITSTPCILEPDSSKKDGKPYFRIVANPLGDAQVIGAAFEKEANGRKFFSVTLDSPLFPHAVNGVMFPKQDDPYTYDLLWDRPDGAKPKMEPRAANGAKASRFARPPAGSALSHA